MCQTVMTNHGLPTHCCKVIGAKPSNNLSHCLSSRREMGQSDITSVHVLVVGAYGVESSYSHNLYGI